MGPCQSKKKDDQKTETVRKEESLLSQMHIPLGIQTNMAYEIEKGSMPSMYLNYFKRKYKKQCKSLEDPMNINKFSRFLSYLRLSNETMKSFYSYFTKDEATIKNFQMLKEGLQKMIFFRKEEQLQSMLFSIYFEDRSNIKSKYKIFCKEMDLLIITSEKGSQIPSNESKKSIVYQIQSRIAEEDLTQQFLRDWIIKYIDLKRFSQLLLSEGFEKDEQLAFYMFNQRDKRPQFDGNTIIISKYWIDKWVKYFTHKYKFNKKQPENAIKTYRDNKSSTVYSNINNYKFTKQEDQNISILFPNEFDNIRLAGNYQWELKKNLRCGIDYLPLDEQIYDQLYLVYGGHPKYIRKIMKGCFQLHPYNVRVYQFINKKKSNSPHLNFIKHLKLSRGDPIQKAMNLILDIFPKEFIIVHRNPGGQWTNLKQYIEEENKEESLVEQIFSQTSFAVLLPHNQYQAFIIYRTTSKIPCVGDMYKNQTNHVCVYEQVVKEYVPYIFLNYNNFFRKNAKLNQFLAKFKPYGILFKSSINPHTQRGCIINLGNSCYLGASLQGLLALRTSDEIFNKTGTFGSEIQSIIKIIENKKKNAFPANFKVLFEERYKQFYGQGPYDAYQFLYKLLEILKEESNNGQIQKQMTSKISETVECKSCKKESNSIHELLMVTLKIKDYHKQTIKINYVANNTIVTTFTFDVDEGSTIKELTMEFQKISKVKPRTYILCSIDNSQILNILYNPNIPTKQTQQKIDLSGALYAYDLKIYKSGQRLTRKFSVLNSGNKKYLTRISRKVQNQNNGYHQDSFSSLGSNKMRNIVEVYDAVIKDKEFHKDIQCTSDQLDPYNPKNQQSFIDLVISNFDNEYQSKIGFPFIVRIRKSYPLSAVREAIEGCLTQLGNCYIRLASIGRLNICELCRNIHCNGKCFYDQEKHYPIQWFQNIGEYVIIWENYKHYSENIKQYDYNNSDENLSFDSFEDSYHRLRAPVQTKCQSCHKEKAQLHRTIISWSPLIILHLSRFYSYQGNIKKVNTRWKLQKSLLIEKQQYVLKAVILHKGTYQTGHYVAVIDNQKYDDELVSPITDKQIEGQQPYIMMYCRVPRN